MGQGIKRTGRHVIISLLKFTTGRISHLQRLFAPARPAFSEDGLIGQTGGELCTPRRCWWVTSAGC